MDRTPKPGEFYRHFKNKMYQIVAIAKHSETKEPLVIYQALYDDYGVYARPLEMFVSEVDHVKYPDVTQKYRFEKVEPGVKSDYVYEAAEAKTDSLNDIQTNADTCVNCSHEDVEFGVDAPHPKLMAFFDADSFEDKYKILSSMSEIITDGMIDNMAVVLDVVIPDGDVIKRYEDLKNVVKTRLQYEYNNRLR